MNLLIYVYLYDLWDVFIVGYVYSYIISKFYFRKSQSYFDQSRRLKELPLWNLGENVPSRHKLVAVSIQVGDQKETDEARGI